MVSSYEVAVLIAIGGVIAATIFRTFLPLFIKIRAEQALAFREGRPFVMPRIENVWLYLAGINIVMVGFPLFATIDKFVEPIMGVTSPAIAFFVVFAAANLTLEGLFRLGDSGVPETKPEPVPAEQPAPAPSG